MLMIDVVGNVSVEFCLPPFGAGFWGGGSFAPFMPMPEAAVDEDHGFIFRQDNIRLPWELFVFRSVGGEAVAGLMQ
jgi:hypothetical protein